ncbi:MAG: EamA family transporter [Saprospiraceae bacterium]|nr:EamA family transporter [Saprospiraceae bacterium]
MKNNVIGLVFAGLWASASVATKIGLISAQPLVIANIRFFIAGFLMFLGAHVLQKYRLPHRTEWLPLLIYGLLNVTIYLGLYILSMRELSAGVGSLTVALNPLMISVLSAFWLKRPVKKTEWLGLFLGLAGVAIVVYPLMQNSYVTANGLILMFFSLLSYSVGTVYYSSQTWQLPNLAINAWQVLLGGVCLLPFTFGLSDFSQQHYDHNFWVSVLWLVFVSIAAVQMWLYLLKIDPVKAALWLYLCPTFGFIYAKLIMDEPVTIYTVVGTLIVILGLYIGQKKNK